jgi:hypothetical protein
MALQLAKPFIWRKLLLMCDEGVVHSINGLLAVAGGSGDTIVRRSLSSEALFMMDEEF